MAGGRTEGSDQRTSNGRRDGDVSWTINEEEAACEPQEV